MQHERVILVNAAFLEQLATLSRSDSKLKRIVEDKARLLACCSDLRSYRTKLKNEQASKFFDILLHIDIGKHNRRMFALVWGAELQSGGHKEVLLPLAISEKRDKIVYSNLNRYVAIAESVTNQFDLGLFETFKLWKLDGGKIIETSLPYWPFAKH